MAVALGLLAAPCHAQPRLDLLVAHDGVYQVGFERLAEFGLQPVDERLLRLSQRGEPVPVWVDGPADGVFGPGDRLTFIGRHMPGAATHFNPETPFNVYRLEPGREGVAGTSAALEHEPEAGTPAQVRRHLERDELRVRFNPRRVEPGAEVWYWQRLSVLDAEPFAVVAGLPFPGDLAERGSVSLKVNLRGWSFTAKRDAQPDHVVEVLWNGRLVGEGRWDGQASHTIDIPRLPAEVLREGDNELQLRVPVRRTGERDEVVADVSLLNWIELAFPLAEGAGPSLLVAAAEGDAMLLPPLGDGAVAYADSGRRYPVGGSGRPVAVQESSAMLLVGEAQEVAAIRPDAPSQLAGVERQADYLMIAHGSLLEAVRPLAEFHRSRGLTVELIDVQDIYDEFNFGILSAAAIKDFIRHAYQHWRQPSPRFVLLVGDASWDSHLDGASDRNYADWTSGMERGGKAWFVKNGSTPYAGAVGNRNLVPTLFTDTFEGYAASDAALVAVDGDDWMPDLAVGRIPVVTPEEVAGVVAKVIGYSRQAGKPGKWRRNLLFITNDQPVMQRKSLRISEESERVGLASTRVFPSEAEKDNSRHQRRLIDAFDEGQLLVHFLGHGGRYIWRTGPPDLKKNHDLFTLEHIDRLAPTANLPLVLSMTCYSAPFDHPTADSIGEKLLRAPERGALGVLAASWRNNPNPNFSAQLLEELTKPDTTVGEAILRAKRETPSKLLVETYNFLGDPAIRLLLPRQGIGARASFVPAADAIRVAAEPGLIEGLSEGRALVELLDAQAQVLAEATLDIDEGKMTASFPQASVTGKAEQARVYAWNDATGVDAVGVVAISREAE